MPTDPIFYLVAIIAVTIFGLTKGGFAGIGMLGTPLLSLVMPPVQAIAIVLPILIVQDAISVWVYRRDWDARLVKLMTVGAVFGVATGWALAAHISDAEIRLAIGLISLAFVLSHWFMPQPKEERGRPGVAAGIFWGGASAFTSTLSNAGGPPFQIYVLPMRMSKLRYVGTTTIFFTFVNWMKLVPFFALGQFSPANIRISLALMPVAIAANFLGVWMVRRISTELFYRIAYAIVFVISLILVWGGLKALLFGTP